MQPLKENNQHFKTIHFVTFIIFLWVIFSHLESDPVDQNQCGSGLAALIYNFLSKIAIYFSLGLHEGRPSYGKSPQKKTTSTFKQHIF
jgi:hypothetical protein